MKNRIELRIKVLKAQGRKYLLQTVAMMAAN